MQPSPSVLPFPDVDRMEEVWVLFDKASEAWEDDKVEEFVAFLAQAFSLDIHDFNHVVMDDPKHNRRACASVFVLGERGSDTPEYHALRIAIALVDTLGFFIFQGVCSVDLSRNYVLAKWTHAVHSTLRLLQLLSDGAIDSLPEMIYWKILSLFGAQVNCLGNIKLSTKIYKKVKILAVSASADTAAITEIDRDITGLEAYPENTCCVCMDVGKALPCGRCGISCYCSKRCQAADWKWNHKDVCGFMEGWEEVVLSKGRN
jgi:hypothetical protein